MQSMEKLLDLLFYYEEPTLVASHYINIYIHYVHYCSQWLWWLLWVRRPWQGDAHQRQKTLTAN